jgi:hypothetical protein
MGARRYAGSGGLRRGLHDEVFSRQTPKTILRSGAILWLASDRGITIETGVSAWVDQSAQVNSVTQTTAGEQPERVLTDLDNKPALSFVAASAQTMSRINGVTGLSVGDYMHVWFVADFEGTTTSQGAFAVSDTSTIDRIADFAQETSNLYATMRLGVDPGTAAEAAWTGWDPATHTGPHLFEMGLNASDEVDLWMDGTVRATSSAVAGGLTFSGAANLDLVVGGAFWDTFSFDGKLYEVVVARAAAAPVAADQVIRVRNYFRNRYPSITIA